MNTPTLRDLFAIHAPVKMWHDYHGPISAWPYFYADEMLRQRGEVKDGWRLLNIGEPILATDELWRDSAWRSPNESETGLFVDPFAVPIRRKFTTTEA